MAFKIQTVPIHLKMTLTIKEAAEYSNIGINKIDSMLRSPNCPFVLYVGTKATPAGFYYSTTTFLPIS